MICALIVIPLAAFVPYKIVTAENHVVIVQIDTIGFIGLIGIIGYLLCFRSFIRDAKGSPLPGTPQNHLIVKGLYRYVRNPMYISWYLIILGETLYFCSLHLLFYLLAWMVFFHLQVIIFEEAWLKKKFGASYDSYCRSVRRWIPRLRAYNNEADK